MQDEKWVRPPTKPLCGPPPKLMYLEAVEKWNRGIVEAERWLLKGSTGGLRNEEIGGTIDGIEWRLGKCEGCRLDMQVTNRIAHVADELLDPPRWLCRYCADLVGCWAAGLRSERSHWSIKNYGILDVVVFMFSLVMVVSVVIGLLA